MKGVTYFDCKAGQASLNEGQYPNVHVRWKPPHWGFYLCLGRGFRLYWFSRK